PLAETAAALRLLHTARAAHPGERAWLGTHLPAYRALSAADPVTALLVPSVFGTVWIADFLTVTPRGGESFEEEVERVRAVPAAAARAQLRRAVGGPLPARRARDDQADR
ncbi:transcriptional regulator, partial [Streptomyces pilosus]